MGDGFTFHKDNVADDFLKRMAIMESGRFRVWSLSYNDVQDVFKSRGDYKTNAWLYEKLPNGSNMSTFSVVLQPVFLARARNISNQLSLLFNWKPVRR